ncbi:hypothetical protein CENSYa_0442 [Cenarchaeum symbiosum A]|uniref:Uncharacterized protein n=1 Tax=Cenarchaeum symbiosum (strain A) TaxID=414004 RepID=A0RUR0_CENSY|nr:hypothetical protein CENSYa_0442 [Cenarchaeum symbiosum A]
MIPFWASETSPLDSEATSRPPFLHISSRFVLYCSTVNTVASSSSMRGQTISFQTNRLFSVADAYLPFSPNINTRWRMLLTELSSEDIAVALDLLEKDWEVDPLLKDFMLRKIEKVSDHTVTVGSVTYHMPYLEDEKKYILWTCLWPDCHNCCDRQGRLPLTSDDLIKVGGKLEYKDVSEFIERETITATWQEPSPGGGTVTLTTINLKRKDGETEKDDGTHVSCRFLDKDGGCTLHPDRPGVCQMYPFSAWLENDGGRARVHAAYQFTGDCPGFYMSADAGEMRTEHENYSEMIYDYAMKSSRTTREGYSASSMH